MYLIQLENLTTIYGEEIRVKWPNKTSIAVFKLLNNKFTLGDFLKMCMKQCRKYDIGMSWPDFCVLAAHEFSILNKVNRPDIWKDRMFILSLLSSYV
jgi:hypothetical protein